MVVSCTHVKFCCFRNLKAELERLKGQSSPAVSPICRFDENGNKESQQLPIPLDLDDHRHHTPEQSKDVDKNKRVQWETKREEDEKERLLELQQKEAEIMRLREELKNSQGQLASTEEQWRERLHQSSQAAAAALERCKRAGKCHGISQDNCLLSYYKRQLLNIFYQPRYKV